MENLNRDELYSICLRLDLPDLLNFCSINTKIYNKICKKDYIWLKLLDRDFKELSKLLNTNYKDLYIVLWNLRDFKNQLNLKQDIYTLYSLRHLDLIGKRLTKLPPSIRFLTNLEDLDLSHNNIEKLPEYMPKSLLYLYVSNGELKELPNCLPDSLIILNVCNNQLKEFPSNLPNSLQQLDVSFNKIKKFHDKLPSSLLTLILSHINEEDARRIEKLYPKVRISIPL